MKKFMVFFLFVSMTTPAWGENSDLSIDMFLKLSDAEQSIFLSGFMSGVCNGGGKIHSYIWSFASDDLRERDIDPAFRSIASPMCVASESAEEIAYAKYVVKWAQELPYYGEMPIGELLLSYDLMLASESLIKLRIAALDEMAKLIKENQNKPNLSPLPSERKKNTR